MPSLVLILLTAERRDEIGVALIRKRETDTVSGGCQPTQNLLLRY